MKYIFFSGSYDDRGTCTNIKDFTQCFHHLMFFFNFHVAANYKYQKRVFQLMDFLIWSPVMNKNDFKGEAHRYTKSTLV